MQVLIEEIEDCRSFISEEAADKPKRYIIEGICIQANVKNRNGRVYPKEIARVAIDKYTADYINKNRAVGELNHPDPTKPKINYERVSHKFESLHEEGDNWIGRAVVTRGTPMGSIIAGLMDEGVQMGISSRARGGVKRSNGADIVLPGFSLITAGDIVSDPSAPDAYLTNLMEGKDWVWADGHLIEQEIEIKNAVNTMARNETLTKENTQRLFDLIMSRVGAK